MRLAVAGAAMTAGLFLWAVLPTAATADDAGARKGRGEGDVRAGGRNGDAGAGKSVPGGPAAGWKADPAAVAAKIDADIAKRLAEGNIPASPLADDAAFLRRATLDITGRIPTAEQVVAFLKDTSADKRVRAVDRLLESPEFGRHLATIWANLVIPRESNLRNLNREPFEKWLADGFNAGRGWDRMVSDMLTVNGDGDTNPHVTFLLAQQENNQPAANKITATVSSLFLGVQLQCAECHNHPFTKWKQTDFWSVAAFFSRVKTERGAKKDLKTGGLPGVSEVIAAPAKEGKGNKPAKPVNKKGAQAETLAGPGGSIIASITIPEGGGKRVSARFPEGEEAVFAAGTSSFRPAFAEWLVSPANKYFAQAFTNRMWSQLFGRGFVNPVDDFHLGNAPSHPALLRNLATEFAASGYDIKHLVRSIARSEAYQRTSRPVKGNEASEGLFARMMPKVMSPEVMFDSLAVIYGGNGPRVDAGKKNPAVGKGNNNARAQFVAFFSTAEEGVTSEEYTHGVPQALRMMNDARFNRGAPVVDEVKSAPLPEAVERLYLTVLSRRPTDAESARFVDYLKGVTDRKAGLSSVLWVLVNTSEFVLNH